MIAALCMYDPRWLRDANDRLWTAIAARLIGIAGIPMHLTRDRPLDDIWNAPDLLLAQTCGYPLMTRLNAVVVATPVYRAPGCTGAWHRSAIIVRSHDPADVPADLAGRRAAINARDSNTGMNLLRATVAPHARGGRFFSQIIETGGHARSVWAVIAGQADCAAIDAVTLALLRDHHPAIDRRIRVLNWTPTSPGLPLITAHGQPASTVTALRQALAEISTDAALADICAALRLDGFAVLDHQVYDAVPALVQKACAAGYPQLA